MSYAKQNFSDGQVLNADNLNHIEDGIVSLEELFNSGGATGEPGKTPVRGIDYWTEADKAEIKGYVDQAILGGSW